MPEVFSYIYIMPEDRLFHLEVLLICCTQSLLPQHHPDLVHRSLCTVWVGAAGRGQDPLGGDQGASTEWRVGGVKTVGESSKVAPGSCTSCKDTKSSMSLKTIKQLNGANTANQTGEESKVDESCQYWWLGNYYKWWNSWAWILLTVLL